MATQTTNKGLSKQAFNENPDTWGTGPLNGNMDVIDQCLGGVVGITTTGGNTNLSSSDIQHAVIQVNGALISNATITFPASKGGSYIVANGTTGSFTLTAVGAGGGTTVVLTQGVRSTIFTDGSNVVLADDRVGAAGSVTNAVLAQAPAYTLKGNTTGSTANVGDYSLSAHLDAAFTTTQGSLLYRNASAWVALAPGTAGQLLQSGGAAANPSFRTVSGFVQGCFKNLTITNGSSPNTQVSVIADSVTLFDGASTYLGVTGVNLVISTGSSGVNGIDTGSVASSTWYSVWVISDGSTTAGLLSTSSTTPTMPGGYTLKARVGWMRTDGSSILYRIKQVDTRAVYVVTAATNTAAAIQIALGAGASNPAVPTWVATGLSAIVPPTAVRAVGFASGGSSGITMLAPSSNYGAYTSTTNPPPCACPAFAKIPYDFVLESTNLYYAANSSDASAWVTGWEDMI